jgi:hypothetical protein
MVFCSSYKVVDRVCRLRVSATLSPADTWLVLIYCPRVIQGNLAVYIYSGVALDTEYLGM